MPQSVSSVPRVFHTPNGKTPYLTEPGVELIAWPEFAFCAFDRFIDGFNPDLGFQSFKEDRQGQCSDADGLIKYAGQMCYLSFTEKRTWNEDISKYMENIKKSGHGSVLEHANFSFALWGISRSLTHELVRHRVGVAYSQLSQRYVPGNAVRFVERPEYVVDRVLHEMFEAYIDRAMEEYNKRASRLIELQNAGDLSLLSGEKKTELRKKVNQAARSCLPNETETAMVFTANGRAIRHIMEMRASGPAEIEIRKFAYRIFLAVKDMAPVLFEDYTVVELPDGTPALDTPYKKI